MSVVEMTRSVELAAVMVKQAVECLLHGDLRFPVQITHGVVDGGDPTIDVLIALAVVVTGRGDLKGDLGCVVFVFGAHGRQRQHFFRQIFDRQVIGWVADVVDAAVGAAIFVFVEVRRLLWRFVVALFRMS